MIAQGCAAHITFTEEYINSQCNTFIHTIAEECVMAQGCPAHDLYILLQGSASIHAHRGRGAHDHFVSGKQILDRYVRVAHVDTREVCAR